MNYCSTTIEPRDPLTTNQARAMLRQGLGLVLRGTGLWIVAGMGGILRAMAHHRARRHLHGLDDRLLRDIGIRRDDIDTAVRDGRPMDRRR